jgi:L-fuconolactonase
MTNPSRRRFIGNSAGLACQAILSPYAKNALSHHNIPILDAHIHLFDPSRPGGVPWPTPEDAVLYHPALPDRYGLLARPEGVLAAIAVECSPLASDNDWLLKTAASNDIIVGVVGDLDPAVKEFSAQLARLAGNPLFCGIRYGNLWGRDLGRHVEDPLFLAHLRELAHSNLVFESANPTPALVADLLRIATKIPDLRIVIDHLPQAIPPANPTASSSYLATLKQLSDCPRVFIKGSEIPRRIGGTVPLTLSTYKAWLDTLWSLFGENRIFFGSDWPNSDQLTPLGDVFTLAQSYLATYSAVAARKFFWSNSVAVYNWEPRNAQQKNAL